MLQFAIDKAKDADELDNLLKVKEFNEKSFWKSLSFGFSYASYFAFGNLIQILSMYRMAFNFLTGFAFLFGVLARKAQQSRKSEGSSIAFFYTTSKEKDYKKSVPFKRLERRYKRNIAIIFIISLAFCSLWDEFCVSSFNEFTFYSFGPVSLSNYLFRYFTMSELCPVGPPCQLYATLTEDAATSVIINAHTHQSYERLLLQYDVKSFVEKNEKFRYAVETEVFQPFYSESIGKRNVHSVQITDLSPETYYTMRLVHEGKVIKEFTYKTLPDENSETPIIIATGGDVGLTQVAVNVTRIVTEYNPDVLIIGGDIAYDNGMCNCYFAYDLYFKPFNELNEKLGRLVPVIIGVGNHDIGRDILAGRFHPADKKGPRIIQYFPHESVYDENGKVTSKLPAFEERKSYHYHKLGKVFILMPDTGMMTGYDGEQFEWMSAVTEAHKKNPKLVFYHNPYYFGCADTHIYKEAEEMHNKLWNPFFFKYRFMTIFENDEHVFKKTYPLIEGEIVAPKGVHGTVFIGNGGWGTWPHHCELKKPHGVYEYIENSVNFIIAVIDQKAGKIKYSAYDKFNKELITSYEQYFADYEYRDSVEINV